MTLDHLDVELLNLLQQDATLPMRTLAARVHSSPATCQRRIARLRETGVLLGTVALVDRRQVGRPLTVFVSVELDHQNDALLRQFELRMAQRDEVLACYEVSGDFDFLLIVNAASMAHYHAFTREAFSAAHNVRTFKSTFALACAKFETRVPIDVPAA